MEIASAPASLNSLVNSSKSSGVIGLSLDDSVMIIPSPVTAVFPNKSSLSCS